MARRITVAITAIALATTLTACGAGNNAPTRLVQQVTDGVEANVKTDETLIYVRNLYISLNQAGSVPRPTAHSLINRSNEKRARNIPHAKVGEVQLLNPLRNSIKLRLNTRYIAEKVVSVFLWSVPNVVVQDLVVRIV